MTRAALLLIVSIGLCSACAASRPQAVPGVVVVRPAACPAPQRPELPALDAALPLDHPANVEALLVRDDIMRHYIGGLEATVTCHGEQAR